MSQPESKPEKQVEYSSFSDAIPAFVRSCYARRERKCDKHYSWDPNSMKLVPYSQDLPVGVHLRLVPHDKDEWLPGSNQSVNLNGLEFTNPWVLQIEVELSTRDSVVAEKFEIPIYEYVVRGWKNEKQAWAIAHSTILRYGLNKLAGWVVFPHYYKGRKVKYDDMLIVAIPKAVMDKIDLSTPFWEFPVLSDLKSGLLDGSYLSTPFWEFLNVVSGPSSTPSSSFYSLLGVSAVKEVNGKIMFVLSTPFWEFRFARSLN